MADESTEKVMEMLGLIYDEVKVVKEVKAGVANLEMSIHRLEERTTALEEGMAQLEKRTTALEEQGKSNFTILERDLGAALDGMSILNKQKVDKKALRNATI